MFADFFVLLYAAHLIADYPLQTDHQARCKSNKDTEGWCANINHAACHLTISVTLVWLVGQTLLDLPVSTAGMFAAVGWIALSHGFIDRRWPVTRWMNFARQTGFLQHGGAAHVDQTFHIALGLIPAAALLTNL